jgi:Ser/Thr protein kinase RdoA (MazF antagonist)
MKINVFFEKVISNLNLGIMLNEPIRVSGGFMHKMYMVETSKGKYVFKLLNPSIMERPTVFDNYKESDRIEEILKENNIPAIYSLEFNNTKMQVVDNQYFYVYNWYDGKVLKDKDIKKINCMMIGEVLSRIHNIDLKEEIFNRPEIHIDWNNYIEIAKEQKSPIYEMLYDKVNILNDIMNKGNIAIKSIPKVISICHNDLDSKNVLWINDEYKIIDLECLGYSNPYLELFELALCWSGYEECNINFDLFKTSIKTYFENSILEKNINWEDIYYSNFGRLEWLEFNIKRALLIECNDTEEKNLGINMDFWSIKYFFF